MMRRASSLVLVTIAILTVLGHVCTGPLAGHAETVPAHTAEQEPHGDAAAHGGSCEAVRAAPCVVLSALPVARLEGMLPALASTGLTAPLPAPYTSPPLFLLHAVLLI